MPLRPRALPTFLAVLAALAGGATWARPPQPPAPEPYVRTSVDEDAGVSTLQTAIRSFTIESAPGRQVTIHLVAAVHVADQAYYDQVQAFLNAQDLVLYEGVRPPGAGVFDADLGDEAKVKATRLRLEFLVSVAERYRSEHGQYPASLDELIAKSDGRLGKVLSGLRADAWGRPITLEVVPGAPAEGQADAPRVGLVLSTPGADGRAGEGGDDVVVRGEMSAPAQDGKPPKDAPNIQQQLADALHLTFQLKGIDYARPNFRPSDLSIDQVQARLAAQGASGDALFSMLDGTSLSSKMAGFFLRFVKNSPRLSAMVKMMMVQMLGDAEKMLAGGGLAGVPGMGDMSAVMKVIVLDRNAVVLDDLRAVLKDEPQVRTIAAFYGGGHSAALERELLAMGAASAGERWLIAITADPTKAGWTKEEVRGMQKMIKGQMDMLKKMGERKP